ncbi:MAG: hypothetical protein IJH71_05160 [Eubacterium sp.]|nr:hypothetical protein [Eubacterium sp.]
MTFEEFAGYVRTHIPQFLFEDETKDTEGRAGISRVLKNNGRALCCLTVFAPGEHASPAIYLDAYYEKYVRRLELEGETASSSILKDLVREIGEEYRRAVRLREMVPFDPEDFTGIRDKIFFCLVNYERNRELLRTCPHLRLGDLALTFRILVSRRDDVIASAMVTDSLIESWGLSVRELAGISGSGTRSLFPPVIRLLEEILPGEMIEGQMDEPVYVISNETGVNGAAVMFYKGVLEELADQLYDDLYILPSSIHEILVIPAGTGRNPEKLRDMVREVNATAVRDEDYLSDALYFYDRESAGIRVWEPEGMTRALLPF